VVALQQRSPPLHRHSVPIRSEELPKTRLRGILSTDMDDNPLTPAESRTRDLERTRLKMDLVKHVSTLSSGAIVILATFLNKGGTPASVDRERSWWILLSVVSFVACLVSSVLYLWLFGLAREWKRPDRPAFAGPAEKTTGFLATLGFCSGILCLGVFVIKNAP
jgi:hypothetical protein